MPMSLSLPHTTLRQIFWKFKGTRVPRENVSHHLLGLVLIRAPSVTMISSQCATVNEKSAKNVQNPTAEDSSAHHDANLYGPTQCTIGSKSFEMRQTAHYSDWMLSSANIRHPVKDKTGAGRVFQSLIVTLTRLQIFATYRLRRWHVNYLTSLGTSCSRYLTKSAINSDQNTKASTNKTHQHLIVHEINANILMCNVSIYIFIDKYIHIPLY